MPRAFSIAFCILLACSAQVRAADAPPADLRIISNIKSLGRLTIPEQTLSADGATARLAIDAPGGIFSFDVDLSRHPRIDKLVFTIRKARGWEGVHFSPADGNATDLKSAPGATIEAAGADCAITLRGEALALFRKGGRFQFIDQYR